MNVQEVLIVLDKFPIHRMSDFTVQNISRKIIQRVFNKQNQQVPFFDGQLDILITRSKGTSCDYDFMTILLRTFTLCLFMQPLYGLIVWIKDYGS